MRAEIGGQRSACFSLPVPAHFCSTWLNSARICCCGAGDLPGLASVFPACANLHSMSLVAVRAKPPSLPCCCHLMPDNIRAGEMTQTAEPRLARRAGRYDSAPAGIITPAMVSLAVVHY